jgi:hypothetical protein
MRHQYKSNWCLIRGDFYKRILLGRDTELRLNLEFIQRGNKVFLANEFLMQGDRGKSGIKIL